MKGKRWLVGGLGVLWLMLTAGLVRPAAAQTNLLQNSDFEEPYSGGLAQGWGAWHEDLNVDGDCTTQRMLRRPEWSPEIVGGDGVLILAGSRSQHVGNQFVTWHGGVMQDVTVTPGSTYRMTVNAWGRASNDQYPAPSDRNVNLNVRVGIDPNGNGLWYDSDIVWGGAINPHDSWQQATVEVAATGSKITVFVAADSGAAGACRAHIDVWFDSASLIEVGPPPTNTPVPLPTSPPVVATAIPPSPTPAPTELPTATPAPTDIPTATPVPGGVICLNAFADENANGQREPTEGYMAGIKLTLAQGGTIVGQGASPGVDDPLCFENLPAGSYEVAQEVPPTLDMTTAGNFSLALEVGQTVVLEFGSRIRPAEQATTTPAGGEETAANVTPAAPETDPAAPTNGGGLDPIAIAGLAILGLAVVLLGAILITLLRQRS